MRYRLGDRLTIKVARVDLETTKIDFTLVNKTADINGDALQANTGAAHRGAKKPSGKNVPKKTTLKLPDKVVKSAKTGSAKPVKKVVKKDRVRTSKSKGKPKR